MVKFYTLVLCEAWLAYLARIKSGARQVILFLMQTAVVFLLLYFQPWVGDLEDEARLAAAGGAAFIASGILSLLWEVIKAPVALHDYNKSEVDRLSGALGFYEDIKALRSQGHDIFERWNAAWIQDDQEGVREHEGEAEEYVKSNFSSSDLMQYRHGSLLFEDSKPPSDPDFYRHRLKRFGDLVINGSLKYEVLISNFRSKDIEYGR